MTSTGILILEKNRLEFLLLKERLVELGFAADHQVHCTTLAELQKPALAEKVPSFVFLDLFLPDSSGVDTFLSVQRIYPEVPIVILSDVKEKETALQCIHLGAQDYLVKGEFSNQLLSKTMRFATERNAYRMEMENRNRQIEGILESISECFFMLDGEWRLQYWNAAAENMYHLKREDILGKSIWELFPNAGVTLREVYERALLQQKTEHFEYYSPVIQKWIALSVYPTQEGGLTVFIKDLTEDRKRTMEILETRNNYQALIDFTADDIWSIDREMKLITGNRSFQERMQRMNGRPKQKGELVLSEELPPEAYEKWKSRYETALSGEAVHLEEAVRFHNGDFFLMEVRFNPIRNAEGEVIGAACHSHQLRRGEE